MSKQQSIQHLRDLTPDPKNARRHTPRNIGMVESALREVGAARSIVIDEDGVVLAGNGVVEAAASAGIEKVQVIEADGNTIIAVRRTGLTAAQKIKLALFDNRTSELADWDPAILADLSKEIDLKSLWSEDEFKDLLASVEIGNGDGLQEDPGPQLDKAEELRKKWRVEIGQLWSLGEHRLLCGDSTKRADVERLLAGDLLRLVWTDPPYGVSYGAKNEFLNAISPGNRIQTPIENDQLTGAQIEDFCRNAFTLACEFSLPGASLYVTCPAGTQLPHFIAAVASSGFQFKHSLVWVKNQFVLGRCDYHHKHEIILYGWKKGAHLWVGDRSQDSVFLVDKPHVSDLHPTTKPIELIEPMIRNSSNVGDIVYDPFLGSGTTMIAAHRLGRRCFGIEIDPGYVAVALERWSILTNKSPKLILGT